MPEAKDPLQKHILNKGLIILLMLSIFLQSCGRKKIIQPEATVPAVSQTNLEDSIYSKLQTIENFLYSNLVEYEVKDVQRTEPVGTLFETKELNVGDTIHLGDDVYSVLSIVHFTDKSDDRTWNSNHHKRIIVKFKGFVKKET
jgi:hypothetical protein